MDDRATIAFNSEYLSALLNSVDASVVATDDKFIIQYWNNYAEHIFGYSAEEVIGKRGSAILKFTYPGESGEELARRKLISDGKWRGTVVYTQKSNSEIILDASVSVVRDRLGRVTGFVGVHRDITEYTKVRHNLSTLMNTLSNIDDKFMVVDSELKVAYVNEKSNSIIGSHYGITFNIGDAVVEKLPAHRKEQVLHGFLCALRGEKTRYEINISDVSGESVWLQANYFPIGEHPGTISHACLVIRDITAARQMEEINEKLYLSNQLFETFMENSPILSWIADSEGCLRHANPAYLKSYQLHKEQLGGKISELLSEPLASQAYENDQLVLQTGQTLKTVEKGTTPDNQEHIYQVIRFPIVSAGNTFIGGWAIDMTEEIILRENLSSSLQRLQQSEIVLKEALNKEHQLNSLKSRFVSMASHEFRTPLSTMLSSTFLLEKYTSSEQQLNRAKHIHKIKESIHHMNALLSDFLSLGKLEEGKIATTRSQFNLPELISDVIEELEPIRRNGQTIYFHHSEIEEIFSDKKVLKNILINLLSNAYKFSGEGKRVWVSAEIHDGHIVISVKDEGIGISPEDQKHMFETFFRAKNAQNIQGTGLGLYIIKRYLELLNGKIEIDSELEKGTVVSIILPSND